MYARTDAHLPRTNNSVEGWHRSFQAGLGSYHLNFWRFLSYLISEDAVHELRRSQLLVGQQAPPPVVRHYAQRNGLDYTCVVLPIIFLFKFVVYILTKTLTTFLSFFF